MHMLEKMNNINFFQVEKKTNQLNEKVLKKQIEYVVRKVNVKKDLTLFPDPVGKTSQ